MLIITSHNSHWTDTVRCGPRSLAAPRKKMHGPCGGHSRSSPRRSELNHDQFTYLRRILGAGGFCAESTCSRPYLHFNKIVDAVVRARSLTKITLMAVVAMRVRSYQNHDNTISLRWIYSNNMTTIRYLMVVVLV